ncbi:MAG TPA: hypothetical protein VEZ17_10575 [Chitinophagaceae bacterium]|nr:hypothetical protein [Chitinophagaceae bacterium]
MRKKNRVLAFIENTLVYFRFAQTCLFQDRRRESNKNYYVDYLYKNFQAIPDGHGRPVKVIVTGNPFLFGVVVLSSY